MIECLSALVFWRKDRRKEVIPVPVERRKISRVHAQKQLMESVDRLSEAVKKAQK